MTTGDETKIETLIDSYGLTEFLDVVAGLCMEKAEHIRSNYGDDDPDADAWEEVADEISNLDAQGL